jgi:hypothetical protein
MINLKQDSTFEEVLKSRMHGLYINVWFSYGVQTGSGAPLKLRARYFDRHPLKAFELLLINMLEENFY